MPLGLHLYNVIPKWWQQARVLLEGEAHCLWGTLLCNQRVSPSPRPSVIQRREARNSLCVSTATSEEGNGLQSCLSRALSPMLPGKENIWVDPFPRSWSRLVAEEAWPFAGSCRPCPTPFPHSLRSCAPRCRWIEGTSLLQGAAYSEKHICTLGSDWAQCEWTSNPAFTPTRRNSECQGFRVFCVTEAQDSSWCPILTLPKEKLVGWVWDVSFVWWGLWIYTERACTFTKLALHSY